MTGSPENLRRTLASVHAEALRVGDSPLRADRLADRLLQLLRDLAREEVEADVRDRMEGALTRAEQALRRDDDGNQAAKHLKEALRLVEGAPGAERRAPWEEPAGSADGWPPRGADRKAPWEE